MYVFHLTRSRGTPYPKDIEFIMDRLIEEPYVPLPDKRSSHRLGHFAKELRDKGLLNIYNDPKNNESIAVLKVNNFWRPDVVRKEKGKRTQYVFVDTLIPKIELPEVEIP